MKKTIILLLLISVNSYSQSVFSLKKVGKKIRVRRTVSVNTVSRNIAVRLANEQAKRRSFTIRRNRLEYEYSAAIVRPTLMYGPNNYLKSSSRILKSQSGWRNIHQSGGYNGAHHIVTKSVIKQLGLGQEAINNAPSIFHPLHNNPAFELNFHNHAEQLKLYEAGGIKLIITNFFEQIRSINEANGLPNYPQGLIDKELIEAEFWAKYWGLKWD